ncbi:MMPL family transporter [Kytococcus sp. Marseille-QA3725]
MSATRVTRSGPPTERGWLTSQVAAPLVALLMVALAAAALLGLPGAQDEGAPASVPQDSQSTQVSEVLEGFPGGDSAPAVVVTDESGPLDREVLGQLQQKAPSLLEALPEDARPDDAEVQGPLPSEDGEAALLVVPVASDALEADGPELVDALRDAAGDLAPGTTTQVTGAAGFAADVSNAFAGADVRLLVVTALVVAVLLLVTYRSPVLWLVPLLVVGLADRVAATVAGTVAEAAGLAFDGSTSGITSVLVFGAGTNYALLLVSRYRDELRETTDHRQALARAWRAALPAVLASNVTVVLTLALLLLAVQPSTRSLGLAAAVGLLVALVFALTLLPALLAVCGRGLFWPFVPRPGQPDPTESGLWHRIATGVVRHPAVVLAASLLALGTMAAGLAGTKVGLSQADQFRVEAESVTGLETLEQHYPAGAATPLDVLVPVDEAPSGDRPAPETAELLQSVDGIDGVTGARPGEVAESRGRTWQRVQVTTDAAPASAEARQVVKAVRATARSTSADALVGGSEAQAVDQRQGVIRDMTVILPLMLVMVLLVLVVVLRSVVAPVLLVAISVIGSLAALGAGALLSEHVFGFPALDTPVPLYAFIFLVALGIDYTIFLVVRAREEIVAGRRPDTASAMVRAVAATGGVITSAGIVLAAVFVVLGVLPIITLTQVGIVVGLGILVDTFLVRTVVVPAVFDLVGDRVWWPAHPGRNARAGHPDADREAQNRS